MKSGEGGSHSNDRSKRGSHLAPGSSRKDSSGPCDDAGIESGEIYEDSMISKIKRENLFFVGVGGRKKRGLGSTEPHHGNLCWLDSRRFFLPIAHRLQSISQ